MVSYHHVTFSAPQALTCKWQFVPLFFVRTDMESSPESYMSSNARYLRDGYVSVHIDFFECHFRPYKLKETYNQALWSTWLATALFVYKWKKRLLQVIFISFLFTFNTRNSRPSHHTHNVLITAQRVEVGSMTWVMVSDCVCYGIS